MCLTGFACTMGGWSPQLAELLSEDETERSATQVLLVDNRGVGRSSIPARRTAYSSTIMATDVLCILVRSYFTTRVTARPRQCALLQMLKPYLRNRHQIFQYNFRSQSTEQVSRLDAPPNRRCKGSRAQPAVTFSFEVSAPWLLHEKPQDCECALLWAALCLELVPRWKCAAGASKLGKGACGGTQHGRHDSYASGCAGAGACRIADAHFHHSWRHPGYPSQLARCKICNGGAS